MENKLGVIKLYGCLFGEDGIQYASNNIELATANTNKYFDLMSKDISERDINILKLRFGFDGQIHTLKEVGQIYGLSSERIRQIEAITIRKLKHPTRRIIGYPILLGVES